MSKAFVFRFMFYSAKKTERILRVCFDNLDAQSWTMQSSANKKYYMDICT